MSTPLNFGNGIVAHFEGVPGLAAETYGRIESGHYGFLAPTVEISSTERGIGDGGTFGSSRATSRRMRCTVSHRALWTRKQIQQVFTPGVLRTLSTNLGSMPYYVEDLEFPESLRQARNRFTVTMWSPDAYPLGATEIADVEGGGGGFLAQALTIEQTANDAEKANGQTFPGTAGHKLTRIKLRTGTTIGFPMGGYVEIWATSGGNTTGTAPLATAYFTAKAKNTTFYVDFDYVFPATATYAFMVWAYSDVILKDPRADIRYQTTNVYAGGTRLDVAGVATTGDLYFDIWTAEVDAGVNTVTFDVEADVVTPCVVTCVMVLPDTSLVISDGTRTTTITHALVAGDVVAIDSANRTVTINGVNSIAKFDRAGDWPLLESGSNTLTITPAAATSVIWQPRLMGLI